MGLVHSPRSHLIWAGLLRDWHAVSADQNWKLVAERESYRAGWFEWWDQTDIDFILVLPSATPAVPHDGMRDTVSSCGYTFLWNIMSAGSYRRLQRLMKRCWLQLIDC